MKRKLMNKKNFLMLICAVLFCFLFSLAVNAIEANVSTADEFKSAVGNAEVDKIIVNNDISGLPSMTLNRAVTFDLNGKTISSGGTMFNVSGTDENTVISFYNGTVTTGNDAITVSSSVTINFDSVTFNAGYDGIYMSTSGITVKTNIKDSVFNGSKGNTTSFVNIAKGCGNAKIDFSAENSTFNFNKADENGAIVKIQNGSSIGQIYLKNCSENNIKHTTVSAPASIVQCIIDGGTYCSKYDTASVGSSVTVNNAFINKYNVFGSEFPSDRFLNVTGKFCTVNENGEHIIIDTKGEAVGFNKDSKYDSYPVSVFEKEYTAPTCTADGYQSAEKCPVCCLSEGEGTVIPMLGHDFAGGSVTAITYDDFTLNGTKVTKCSRCDKTEEDNTLSPIFKVLGYSKSETDGVIGLKAGYSVDFDALKVYEDFNDVTVEYGMKLANAKYASEISDDASENVFNVALTGNDYNRFNTTIVGFNNTDAHKNLSLIMLAYAKCDGKVQYIQAETSSSEADGGNGVTFKTINIVTVEAAVEAQPAVVATKED